MCSDMECKCDDKSFKITSSLTDLFVICLFFLNLTYNFYLKYIVSISIQIPKYILQQNTDAKNSY